LIRPLLPKQLLLTKQLPQKPLPARRPPVLQLMRKLTPVQNLSPPIVLHYAPIKSAKPKLLVKWA